MKDLSVENIEVYGSNQTLIFLGLTAASLAIVGIYFDLSWIGIVLPAASILGFLIFYRISLCLIGLFLVIPICAEIVLPGGLGVDIPAEPILWLLMVSTILVILKKRHSNESQNKVTTLLIIHLIWIFFSALLAEYP